jgi:hypothetical protein
MKHVAARVLVCLLWAGMLPNSGMAQEPRTVSVLGLGLLPCEEWTQLHRAGAGDVADQWLLGFLSGGAAFARSNYLAATNLSDAVSRFWAYCTANPKSVLATAAMAVAKDLGAPARQTDVR